MESLRRRLDAQKLDADRTGELQRLQERQKKESARQQAKKATRTAPPRPAVSNAGARGAHPDLQDLDFGTIGKGKGLPPPIRPDSDDDSNGRGWVFCHVLSSLFSLASARRSSIGIMTHPIL